MTISHNEQSPCHKQHTAWTTADLWTSVHVHLWNV